MIAEGSGTLLTERLFPKGLSPSSQSEAHPLDRFFIRAVPSGHAVGGGPDAEGDWLAVTGVGSAPGGATGQWALCAGMGSGFES